VESRNEGLGGLAVALRDVGLNDLQEQVYRELLARPAVDPAELACLSGGDREQLRDALAALVRLGLGWADQGAPAGVRLADPAIAVSRLIERTEDALLRHHRRVAETRTELATLVRLYAGRADQDGPALELTDDDRRVLALLARGCTDETAARQVGVSVRHLRRRVARLMNHLQVTSRFSAGVAAAHRGWI
jgi:DNA-binding NarL/FixJ family response regulator